MKKILALILATLLTVSALAISVSAGYIVLGGEATADNNFGNSYTVKRTSTAITLDGKATEDEDWAEAQKSEAFELVYYDGTADSTTIDTVVPTNSRPTTTLKAMWYTDGTDYFLYILIESNDQTVPMKNGEANYGEFAYDSFHAVFDENGDGINELQLPAMYLTGRSLTENQISGISRYTYASDLSKHATGGGYTMEMQYKFKTASECANTVMFDFACIDGKYSDGKYSRYSWNGLNNTNQKATGVLNISSEMVNAVDENADVVYYNGEIPTSHAYAENGSVTLAVALGGRKIGAWKAVGGTKLYAPGSTVTLAENEKLRLEAIYAAPVTLEGAAAFIGEGNKLRFDAEITDLDKLGVAAKEAGFIFVKADLLTEDIVATGITEEALTAANITFTKVPASAVAANISCELTAADDTTEYAAVSYLKYALDAENDAVVYSKYDADANVRCVEAVAKAAYNDRSSVKKAGFDFKILDAALGIENFEIMSYSPYTVEQLLVLKALGKIS